MYANKENILQLLSLLKAHHITHIITCPGSRNAPLIHSFAVDKDFTCHAVTDERSAGFYALGLCLQESQGVAVCCTSGSALLNLHPAVSEAYYQQLPLIVISADRPAAWIGQMDGQTVPQPHVFASLCKRSVTLPEGNTAEEEWYCNRLINEALLARLHRTKGPVHINVPIGEPLFDFTVSTLPKKRIIRYEGLNPYHPSHSNLVERINQYEKKMMLVGQTLCIYEFGKHEAKQLYKHFVWLSEHLGNGAIPGRPIKNFDTLLRTLTPAQEKSFAPDLLITYGGHIVSKQIKRYLRTYPPREHWHISSDGAIVDLFGALTTVIEMDPFEFLDKIGGLLLPKNLNYPQQWEEYSKKILPPSLPYCGITAVGKLLASLPDKSALHLGNSSAVRYAQLFPIPSTANIEIYGNRGTSGIEGSLSTALGHAQSRTTPTYIILGDLSFFYDMNALWQKELPENLRILLLNNGGGGIFYTLPSLELTPRSKELVTAQHNSTAESWATAEGVHYLKATQSKELEEGIALLTDTSTKGPLLLEVFTDSQEDAKLLQQYYQTVTPKRL